MEKIFVVIPNWNGADLLPACLKAVQKQSQRLQCIVVDNGSVDKSCDIVREQFPDIQLVELPKNHGFAGGVNAGIAEAMNQGADAVALLNNDAVPDKDWLKNLVSTLKDNQQIGIVTSKILRSDKKRIDSTGDFYCAWGTAFPRGRDEKDAGQYDNPEEVFGASGGASLYRTTMLDEIGLFDNNFFAYYEDVDISFRAQLAGWKIFYQPQAVVYHEIGSTSSKVHNFTTYHSLKNLFFLPYKNLPIGLLLSQLPKRAIYYSALHVRAWLSGKILASLKAIGMIIILFPKMTWARWRIQRRRKVGARQINSLIHHGLPPSTKRKLGRA